MSRSNENAIKRLSLGTSVAIGVLGAIVAWHQRLFNDTNGSSGIPWLWILTMFLFALLLAFLIRRRSDQVVVVRLDEGDSEPVQASMAS